MGICGDSWGCIINFFADVTHDPGGRARGDEMWFGM